jgi:hypothetical protein
MKARFLTLAAVVVLAACGGGGEQEPKAGDSADPGPTGTIESTSQEITTGTPVDTMTATSGSTAGGMSGSAKQ